MSIQYLFILLISVSVFTLVILVLHLRLNKNEKNLYITFYFQLTFTLLVVHIQYLTEGVHPHIYVNILLYLFYVTTLNKLHLATM